MSKASRQKQRIWLILGFIIVGYAASGYSPEQAVLAPQSSTIERAFQQQQSDLQVEVTGIVIKLLSDDEKGSRHQRFIIKLVSGQTILIAHNIDLALKISQLNVGDEVSIYGEYEWNDKGGVLHWTHHDPAKRHIDGWIKHHGKTYQ